MSAALAEAAANRFLATKGSSMFAADCQLPIGRAVIMKGGGHLRPSGSGIRLQVGCGSIVLESRPLGSRLEGFPVTIMEPWRGLRKLT